MLEAQNSVIDESDVQIPLPLEQNVPETRSFSETNKLHQQILASLGPSPIAEDQLLRDIGAQTSRMIPILTNLEMDGQIRRAPGGMISRA
jgi:DNA processing protein